ncbi:hypothetical protein E2C01_042008 [Portunus trituberculatus]
MGMLV